jgi:cell division protein FtsB
MVGISLGKLLLLALLVLAIWYGFKYVNRVEEVRQTIKRAAREAAQRSQARAEGRQGSTAIKAEDMVKCAACGVYVTKSGATNCGRPDCPW